MNNRCPRKLDARHASYRYDTETGLYYCWNRYYAPELARFLTRDIYPGELSDPVTMNPYLYCGGDPVNQVDPSGMAWTQKSAWSMSLAVLGVTFATAAAIALVAGSAGTLTPIAAAMIGASLSTLGGMTSVASLKITEEQRSVGEIDDAQYRLQMGFGYWGLASSVVSGGLSVPGAPQGVAAYAAVHSCNVAGTSLMIGVGAAAADYARSH